jgi:hypothetical protein
MSGRSLRNDDKSRRDDKGKYILFRRQTRRQNEVKIRPRKKTPKHKILWSGIIADYCRRAKSQYIKGLEKIKGTDNSVYVKFTSETSANGHS